MAVTVTDTAMASGKLSLAMATEVTGGAMVATGEAMADTVIMASATLRPLPLLSLATVTEDMATEATAVMEVMAITAGMAAMVMDMDTASVMLSLAMAMAV